MSKPPMRSLDRGRKPPASVIDACTVVPISACVFALIVSPLLIFVTSPAVKTVNSIMESRPENRIFWPAMALISVILAVRNRSRLRELTVPPHIVCFLLYLALAGASAIWAFKPELSFIRFVQQLMIVTSIVLPAMLAAPTADMMRGLFLCFAAASLLNVFFVLGGSPVIAMYGTMSVNIGYAGYFPGKNYLGECAAAALLLSLHEMLYPGLRRVLGTGILVTAAWLLFVSDSKTALGLAFIAPVLAGIALIAGRKMRLSPAVLLFSIPLCYFVFSMITGFSMNRVAYMLYGDSTFTGRTLIWDFASHEIEQRRLLGWGYQSFWLVGGDGPSILEAPGWIKNMPNSHNGYYDVLLELGYVGFAALAAFIFATLHGIGRVAGRNPSRAWLMLSLAIFIILYNYLESLWVRGFEFLWVVFLIIAAETARHWQPSPLAGAAYGARSPGPGSLGPSHGARRHRLRTPA